YREDSNEAAFTVDKIYAHELLTFNDTVACEVISKWKTALKEDMDARSYVYVLSNGCRKSSDDRNDYYWEYTLVQVLQRKVGIDFVGRTLHTIVRGSLSGDCDVEKNGKWPCIYAVGSQEYLMVCTRLELASTDVGMLDKFDRGLQTDIQVFVDFDYAMAAYMTLKEAAKEAIWLKRLTIESGFMLKIVAGARFQLGLELVYFPLISTTRSKTIVTKPHSPPRRNINRRPSPKPSTFPPKVTIVKAPMVNAVKGVQGNWGNPQHALKDKRVIDSGCSRHMTGNMSYLSDFKEINGGYVAFGGNLKGGKISGKGKIRTRKLDFDDVYFVKELKFNLFSISQMCDKKNIVLFTYTKCIVLSPEFKPPDENQVLLRVPRENNMYNVDLKNIVSSGVLTCLFVKSILDESNLWHKRLGHINFKTMNKLVKGNLVRGLPSKVFENNHTCVACKKGTQHRASCKTKLVSSVSQPLQRVLVTKPQNKTSYELLLGRTPSIGFMRCFGHPVTILNTIDPLGKFDGKANEEFLVGYSCPTWLFDIDTLTKSMNYQPVTAGNQSNPSAGVQEQFVAEKLGRIVCNNMCFFPYGILVLKILRTLMEMLPLNTNTFSAAGPSNIVVSPTHGKSSYVDTCQYPDDPNMLELEDITYFDDEEDVGVEADFTNLETNITVSPIPTTRVHKDHPMTQIIGDLSLATQTRIMTRIVKDQEEPKRVHQALKDPSWIEAMQEELLQFKMQKVWVLVDLPNGKRAIGHTQKEGINYEEVFSPVARKEAIRLFLAYASLMGFMVYQMDVKSAFIYGIIKEEVYICQPLGFEDPDYPDKVYKVVKALYGLHQAPRAWYETLANHLLENSFQRGKIDQTLFIKRQKGDILLVHIYVDDIIFGYTNKDLCKSFYKLMKYKFQMSSMGEITFILGLQVKQKPDEIFIIHDKYVAEILRKFGLTDRKSASTPIDTEKPLLKDPDGEDLDVHTYRSMIGSLMYLTLSRPDIMFVVCACARFQVTPKVSHLPAVKRIFRYLKSKPYLGLWYPKDSPFNLVAYSDSDYAGASLDRKSTTGGCQFL
nr:hypothetical protein [Tanacetum cinerariifolium]